MFLQKYYSSLALFEVEMCCTCVSNGGERYEHSAFSGGNQKERGQVVTLSMDRKVTLKYILKRRIGLNGLDSPAYKADKWAYLTSLKNIGFLKRTKLLHAAESFLRS